MIKPHAHPLSPGGPDLPLGRATRPYVVGVDTSSARLAVSLPGAKTFVHDAIGSPDERRIELFRAARECFEALPAGAYIWIEEPISLQNGATTRLLGLAAGAIWAAGTDSDVYLSWMNISTWKKAIGLGGNIKKEFVRPAVEAIPSFRHEDREMFLRYPDLYDAFAIRLTGVRLLHAMA